MSAGDFAGPLPPHSTDAEQAVLGSLLIDPDGALTLGDLLAPDDFYHPRHRSIFTAMLALVRDGQPTDFVTVPDELERRGVLADIGGLSYLATLLSVVPTSVHLLHYAEIVQRTALMRRLIRAAGQIAQIGYEDEGDPDAAIARAHDAISRVGSTGRQGGLRKLDTFLDQFWETDAVGGVEGKHAAVQSGYLDLDRLLGGMQRTDLIILAARPAMGKTSLAMNIARTVAVCAGETVGMFSIEMSGLQLAQRFLSMEADVDSTRLREGRVASEELRRLSGASKVLQTAPLYLDDTRTLTVTELRARALRFHATNPLGLLIVDYLQLLTSGQRGQNRVEEVSAISRTLKALAGEINAPLLALSQLSRAVEQRQPHIPKLADLRESGGIEQDADVVLMLYREDMYDRESERRGVVEVHVAKHRNGPTGVVSLLFHERSTRFANLGVPDERRE